MEFSSIQQTWIEGFLCSVKTIPNQPVDLSHHLIFCDLAVNSDIILFSCPGTIGLLFLRAIPSQVSSWLTLTMNSSLTVHKDTPFTQAGSLGSSLSKRVWSGRSIKSPLIETDLPDYTFFPEKLDLSKILGGGLGNQRLNYIGLNSKRQIVSLFVALEWNVFLLLRILCKDMTGWRT